MSERAICAAHGGPPGEWERIVTNYYICKCIEALVGLRH